MTCTMWPVWSPKVGWYSPCTKWIRYKASGSSFGRFKIWGGRLGVCKGFCGWIFLRPVAEVF